MDKPFSVHRELRKEREKNERIRELIRARLNQAEWKDGDGRLTMALKSILDQIE